MLTKVVEEYVEVIYDLGKGEKIVDTNSIASTLNVKPGSVTEMLKKLQNIGLVNYVKYRGVTLTSAGCDVAQELREKHRILAEFLEIIGIQKEIADIDACQIEHNITQVTMEQLNKI